MREGEKREEAGHQGKQEDKVAGEEPREGSREQEHKVKMSGFVGKTSWGREMSHKVYRGLEYGAGMRSSERSQHSVRGTCNAVRLAYSICSCERHLIFIFVLNVFGIKGNWNAKIV